MVSTWVFVSKIRPKIKCPVFASFSPKHAHFRLKDRFDSIQQQQELTQRIQLFQQHIMATSQVSSDHLTSLSFEATALVSNPLEQVPLQLVSSDQLLQAAARAR